MLLLCPGLLLCISGVFAITYRRDKRIAKLLAARTLIFESNATMASASAEGSVRHTETTETGLAALDGPLIDPRPNGGLSSTYGYTFECPVVPSPSCRSQYCDRWLEAHRLCVRLLIHMAPIGG